MPTITLDLTLDEAHELLTTLGIATKNLRKKEKMMQGTEVGDAASETLAELLGAQRKVIAALEESFQ
jgi:hypothetical protein